VISFTGGGMRYHLASIAFTTSFPTAALARNPYYGGHYHDVSFFDVLWFLLTVFVVVGVISALNTWWKMR
jgi:hypothetical protein